MGYCTRADMVDRFGEQEVADLEAGRSNAMDEAIDDAAALIDSYIGARYSLPLLAAPVQLLSISRDLVRYSLDMVPDETVRQRRDYAIKYLESLAAGRATLGIPQASEPAGSDTAEMISAPTRWGRGNSSGFI